MSIYVGIDIGAISVKAAVVADPEDRLRLERLAEASEFTWLPAPRPVLLSTYRRALGDPRGAGLALIGHLQEHLPDLPRGHVHATGRGASLLYEGGVGRVNDAKAITAAMGLLHPDVATVFEMGGESSRFLRLGAADGAGRLRLQDYETNGDCAAGTGSFIDQQATRLRYAVEEVGAIACGATRAARIAGRCSVFAKSDMIHAQQKGASPPEILRGLCEAVARNFKGAITQGEAGRAAGGLHRRPGDECRRRPGPAGAAFKLDAGRAVRPRAYAWCAAIGAALLAAEPGRSAGGRRHVPPDRAAAVARVEGAAQPLELGAGAPPARIACGPDRPPAGGERRDAYLGIDVGSVSTNLVVLDDDGRGPAGDLPADRGRAPSRW